MDVRNSLGDDGAIPRAANKILLVEDSRFFTTVVRQRIEKDLKLTVLAATTLAEARELVAAHRDEIFLALLDLVLPDAPDGEIVDEIRAFQIPSIVFSAHYSDDIRDMTIAKGAIDFVVKESPASFQYLIDQVRRIHNNRSLTALVVDDSSTARRYLRRLLESQQLDILEAADGEEALQVLEANPCIKIEVTDYAMLRMDGFEFIKAARRNFDKEALAIIGISASGSAPLSAKFLKVGANDFINKPFLHEEFICRLSQNLDLLERMDGLREAATTDPLTGLHNRRYFFDAAGPLYASAARGKIALTVATIDVDHFKRVNDVHGHDAGDVVLQALARTLDTRKRQTDLLARFGGEEFCYLLVDMSPDHVFEFFDDLRGRLEALQIEHEGVAIPVTASIGVSGNLGGSLDEMIRESDAMLYCAKEGGRNQVAVAEAAIPSEQAVAS